jgi:carotenoid 1,2-hydratase
LRGRQHPSGGGSADGGLVRTVGGLDGDRGPCFDRPVPPGGYLWWYVDAIADEGGFGLTIIGFVGSVFSPYYKASGRGDPLDHSAINVALYGPRGSRWAMTERGRGTVARAQDHFAVGPSAMRWSGDGLTIDLDEIAVPIPRRVRGRIRLLPEFVNPHGFALDPQQRHHWRPIAPRARVEVEFDRPDLKWRGHAYFDSNFGVESLEEGFVDWQWSRAHLGRDVAVLYEGVRADRSRFAAALRFDRDGSVHEAEPPRPAPLPPTLWLMNRTTRADDGRARVTRTWEDAPFYARSALETTLFGERVEAVHESLSLTRFVSPVVQWMLPFRMPRRPG